MSLLDTVAATGPIPADDASREVKKANSERLSRHLAEEVAEGLRRTGFPKENLSGAGRVGRSSRAVWGQRKSMSVIPTSSMNCCWPSPSRRSASPRSGRTRRTASGISAPKQSPSTRFPYSVVCALFAFPTACNEDFKQRRSLSTFRVATRLFSTISGSPRVYRPR